MAKTITITFGNETYTLEFNRRAVFKMEDEGLKPDDLRDKPMSSVYRLFKGAFTMHHPRLGDKVIDDIYDALGDKANLFTKLAEMYTETVESIVGDGTSEKNAPWEANW